MAKYRFTQLQFDRICLLLKRRKTESHEEQKKTRKEIRTLGFNISDHCRGFSDTDFKELLANGDIEIIDKQNFDTIKIFKNPTKKETTPSKQPTDMIKQALPAVIDKDTEYLILGTMPGEESLRKQEYYSNSSNQFWKIIASIFNDGNVPLKYSDKVNVLKKNKIGLWDVLHSCEREGSLDNNIKNGVPNNFDKLFKDFPNIKTVIFNGKDSHRYFDTSVSKKKYIQVSSTSSANTHKTLDEKTTEWKKALS